jgi:hypothetical protein
MTADKAAENRTSYVQRYHYTNLVGKEMFERSLRILAWNAQHRAMKAYWGSGGIAPSILGLGTWFNCQCDDCVPNGIFSNVIHSLEVNFSNLQFVPFNLKNTLFNVSFYHPVIK